jgi:hypothetical protein
MSSNRKSIKSVPLVVSKEIVLQSRFAKQWEIMPWPLNSSKQTNGRRHDITVTSADLVEVSFGELFSFLDLLLAFSWDIADMMVYMSG